MIRSLKRSFDLAHEWIGDVQERLGTDDQDAYIATKAVLHALRDRMMLHEAIDFGAQLPLVLRGAYYDGYRPSETPMRIRDLDNFYGKVAAGLERKDIVPQEAVAAVTEMLRDRMSEGQWTDTINGMPGDIAEALG